MNKITLRSIIGKCANGYTFSYRNMPHKNIGSHLRHLGNIGILDIKTSHEANYFDCFDKLYWYKELASAGYNDSEMKKCMRDNILQENVMDFVERHGGKEKIRAGLLSNRIRFFKGPPDYFNPCETIRLAAA